MTCAISQDGAKDGEAGRRPHGANALWLSPDLSTLFVGYEDGRSDVFKKARTP